jgi:sulfur-carrier protein
MRPRVKVRIFHPVLQQVVGGANEVFVEGGTVGECLDDLVARYPGAREAIFDSRGQFLRQVYVFVNHEGLTKAPLSRAVTEKDVLIVAALAHGG